MENITLGRRIAAHRKRLKMTQDALAQELGISPQAVSKWENDQSCPDIALLPRLADIFGITADELLGAAPKTTTGQMPEDDASIPEIRLETDEDNGVHIEFNHSRSWSLTGSIWIISIGAMMLLGLVLKADVGFWSAAWVTGLLVFGLRSLSRRIRFSGLTAVLAGGYFVLEKLELIHVRFGWDLVLPVLFVALGLSLLLENFGRKKPKLIFSSSANQNTARIWVKDGILEYSDSFGDHRYTVSAPLLKGGRIQTSFGDHTLDFSGVDTLTPKCQLQLDSSFGDVTLLIPRRFRVELTDNRSFSDVEVLGHPLPDPEGTLTIHANISFSDLTIEYI